MQKRGRVTLLVTLSMVVLLVLLSGVGSGQSRPPRTVTVGIGVHEQSTFQQAVQYYNEKHRIIEKTAKELFNIDLKLKWYTFPFAPQHIAAMQAGDVQIGSFATFPIITQIKKRGVTLAPLTESLGAYEFLLMVKKDGPIKTFEDLKGKNVAVPVGTSPHGAFELFVLTEFGKTPRELGINIVNQPWHAAYMPPGIDAFITYYPAATIFLGTEIVPLVSMLGYTGEAYDGPLGKGAGHRIPSVKNSPFYPEGYIALRNWFMAANGYEKKEPEVCIAFMVGHQKIIQALAKMTPHEITEYYPADEWKTTPRKAYEELALARDLVYKHRDWVWLTEGEVKILLTESKLMQRLGVLNEPLTEEEVKTYFTRSADLMRKAYELSGHYPPSEEFTRTNVEDFRGKPVWELWK